MAHPAYLRQKAIEMRVEGKLSIDEIAERLALSKTTIYYWVKDIPLGRPRRWSAGQRLGNERMQAKWKARRDAAYDEGLESAGDMLANLSLRDFVNLYIAEGYKRNRNTVSICNSDPWIVLLGARWICRLTSNKVRYSIQYHADQDLDELRAFWSKLLEIDPSEIHFQRKSNSNQLTGRKWRSEHGVLAVSVGDTYLRARLQAWMDVMHDAWDLDFTDYGEPSDFRAAAVPAT